MNETEMQHITGVLGTSERDLRTEELSQEITRLRYEPGIREIRMRASQGDPSAQLQLAIRYRHGRGVRKSQLLMLWWLHQAAEHQFPEAQYVLACMILQGQGEYLCAKQTDLVGQSDHKASMSSQNAYAAIPWFTKAAEHGHIDAMHDLSFLYSGMLGVQADKALSTYWKEREAEARRQTDLEAKARQEVEEEAK